MNHRVTFCRGGLAILTLVFFAFVLHTAALAQRVVNIPPGFGTLNAVISGDTLPGAVRVDSNTVYRLQRGGLYILNGTFEHRYQVFIEAAPGAGAKPRIIQGVPSGGVAPANAWQARGTLRMKNIYISALDELGGGHERIIRIFENGIRLTIDSCVLDRSTQAGIRFDGTGAKVYLMNSIVSNIGTPDSPNNGRGFDDRGNDIDTLWLVNSTFINLTSRVIRDAGGITHSCKVDHCTMHNIGQWGVSFGPCNQAIFTNNLFSNGGFYGANPRGLDLTGNEPQILITLKPVPPGFGTQTADVRNNSFYLDSLVIKAYPDTIHPLPLFDSVWTSYLTSLGTAGTIYNEKVTFQHSPDAPAATVTDWYLNPAPPNPGLDTVTTDNGPFNFAYPTGQLAYTRADESKPLGDLNWFGIPLVSVPEPGLAAPAAFRLYGNYPNPFNPETNIRFDIHQSGPVVLEVFNALGQKIATLANEVMSPGTYEVRWNGRRDDGVGVAAGVYLFRLKANNFVDVKKMAFVK